jgi:hypothetical protein
VLSKKQIITEFKEAAENGMHDNNDIFIHIVQKHKVKLSNDNDVTTMIGFVADTISEYLNEADIAYDRAMGIVD